MAPIYSTQLVNREDVGAFSGTVYTVPAGATVVVTDVDTWLDFSAPGQASIVGLELAFILYEVAAAAGVRQVQWTGKQVLNAGQVINWDTTAAISTIAVTGYLLRP